MKKSFFLVGLLLPVFLLSCDRTVGDRDGSNFRSETHKSEGVKGPVNKVAADSTVPHKKEPEYLYALVGSSGSYNDSAGLVLNGLRDGAVFFAERPGRKSGSLELDDFRTIWEGEMMQKALNYDPPNALLSITENGQTSVSVVEILEGEFVGNNVTFQVAVLEGVIPETFGSNSLVIDAFPTPVNSQVTDLVKSGTGG